MQPSQGHGPATHEIRAVATPILAESGQTQPADLIRAVARPLGHQRVGAEYARRNFHPDRPQLTPGPVKFTISPLDTTPSLA